MQAITHFGAGVCLSLLLTGGGRESLGPRGYRLGAVALLAALSHPILDDLAQGTYHPPRAHWDDLFWVSFHGIALALAVGFAWRFRRHGWGMLFSLTPDLDWLVGRPLGLWSDGGIHASFRTIPGLEVLSEALQGAIPDLREVPAAAALEGVLIALLVATAWNGERKPRDEGKPLPSNSQGTIGRRSPPFSRG